MGHGGDGAERVRAYARALPLEKPCRRRDSGERHIPSDITIHFVDEIDDKASPIGGKGVGELGATGVAAAIANAVFHATGKRIRDLPITPEKLIA